jgi:kynurenine formamidase
VITLKAVCPEFREQTEVEIFGEKYILTDLSHDLSPKNPVFTGHLKTVMWDHLTHEETMKSGLTKAPYSYRVVGFLTCDHNSTHVDSINHVVADPDARSIDRLPLEWFFAPGVWLDFSQKAPSSYITKEDVQKQLASAGATIKPNSVVLIYTGWYKKWNSPFEYLRNYPGLDRGATEFLADSGAINIGADAPSTDTYVEVTQVKVQPMHIVCREREILNMENVANIDKIPKHMFWFIALPLKLHNATGSPIRAVALVKK